MPRCASCQLFIKGLLSRPALTIISANGGVPSAVKHEIIIQLGGKCNCQALSLQAKHKGINNSYHQDTKNEPAQRKHTSKIVRLLLSLILLSLQHPLLIGNIRSLSRSLSSISVTSVYTSLYRMIRLDCETWTGWRAGRGETW